MCAAVALPFAADAVPKCPAGVGNGGGGPSSPANLSVHVRVTAAGWFIEMAWNTCVRIRPGAYLACHNAAKRFSMDWSPCKGVTIPLESDQS